MNTTELEQHYLQQKQAEMSFSEIRKEMVTQAIPEETISAIIRHIDRQNIDKVVGESAHKGRKELRQIGILLMTGGLVITILTFTGIIFLHGHAILAFGPVISGLFMVVSTSKSRKPETKMRKQKHYIRRGVQ